MDRTEIIKALEHCIKDDTCEQCNYSPSTCFIQENALSLIKELATENKQFRYEQKKLIDENERLSKEVADLQDELECEKETNKHLCGEYMSAKADTVRKMQERLHSRKVSYGNITFRVVPIDEIDQIAKEMVEDTK